MNPPDWYTFLRAATYNNVITVGEPLTVVAEAKGSPLTDMHFYDLYGNAVISAGFAGDSDVTTHGPEGSWKPGWYMGIGTGRLKDDYLGTIYGSAYFSVWRDLGHLPGPSDLPPYGTSPNVGADDNNAGFDLYLHGWTAMGPQRYIFHDAVQPTVVGGSGTNLASIQELIVAEQNQGRYLASAYQDAARPRPAFVAFCDESVSFFSLDANVTAGTTYTSLQITECEVAFSVGDEIRIIWGTTMQSCTVAASVAVGDTVVTVNAFQPVASFPSGTFALNATLYRNGIANAVAALSAAPYNIMYYEGINEPTGEKGFTQSEAGNLYTIFRQGVKAGNPNAKALGPAEVTYMINGASYGGPLHMSDIGIFLSRLPAGGLDVFSGHFYNAYLDPLVWKRTLLATRQTLQAAGYPATTEIWVTEGPSVLNGGWGDNDTGRAVQSVMWFYVVGEQCGLPKEHVALFYDSSHGFNDYPSWIKEGNSLFPAATGLRVRSEEIYGKAFDTALGFGALGEGFFIGNVLRGATGTCVEVIATGNIYDEITLAISDTGNVTYSDWQGRVATVPVVDGKVTIPVNALPTYIRLSQGSTVTVTGSLSKIVQGTNVAPSATAVSGTGAAGVGKINDGIFQVGHKNGTYDTQGTAFMDTSELGANSYVELDWATQQVIGSIAIRSLPAWEDNSAAILRATLQYWDGITWKPCPTVPRAHWNSNGEYANTTAWSTPLFNPDAAAYNAILERWSPWDYQWSYSVNFSVPVTTTKLRLVVYNTTYGHGPDASVRSVGGQNITISEFCVFSVPPISDTIPGGGGTLPHRLVMG